MRYVLDTNIISFILRANGKLLAQLNQALITGHEVLGCPVVWYEVRRGLLARNATAQLVQFEQFFTGFLWDDYTRADWRLAGSLWAQRRAQGQPIDNADLFIAVFTINRDAILVSDNEKDFVGLGLVVENWTK